MTSSGSSSVKRAICDAVVCLLARKPYTDITVTDVVTTAQVARASFYRSFGSVRDVIELLLDKSFEEMAEGVFPVLQSRDERAWRAFLFNHFYLFTRKQQRMRTLLPQNRDMLFSGMERRMREHEAGLPSETVADRYAHVGKIGLINGITRKWMDSGMKETPEELIDYIMSFILLF